MRVVSVFCRLDPIICYNKQKWNKDRCRCECLINKKCGNKFWNPNTCKCEYRAAELKEKCEEITDNKMLLIKHNKTVLTKESNSCKPYVASSILFLLISVTLTGLFIFFIC